MMRTLGYRSRMPLRTSWTPVRVVSNGKSVIGGGTPAARGRGGGAGGGPGGLETNRWQGWLSWGVAGMFEDDRVAAVEFGPQRLERWISEVFARVAGHKDHAVGVQ